MMKLCDLIQEKESFNISIVEEQWNPLCDTK